MYMYTQGHSRLISTGVYLPEQRVTSQEIMEDIDSANRFGVSANWIEKTMGIRERRVAPDGMLPSEMALRAAREALDHAGLTPAQLDAVIYTGFSRDHLEPATAHIVQGKLGARNAVAFDVTNACHGFMNGIHLMDALIATGQARRGLVLTGELGSLVTDKTVDALKQTTDRETFNKLAGGLTLGDAGAALVMGPKTDPDTGFMGFMLQSAGELSALCLCGHQGQESALYTDMPTIVMHNERLHSAMYREFMARLGWKSEDIARFVHHQVGIRIFRQHARYAGISTDIMPNTLTLLGNMITANIPVNLYNLAKNKEVSHGQKLFLSGSGSGLAISQSGLVWEAA
jgi:3-oxoacyl-[acyl-carrier-protein] synthase-3